MGKQMEGDNKERRKAAKEAREHGRKPSEVGATTSSSKQRTKASGAASHQEKIDLKREGKHDVISQNTPETRPGSRDPGTDDRQRRPRLD